MIIVLYVIALVSLLLSVVNQNFINNLYKYKMQTFNKYSQSYYKYNYQQYSKNPLTQNNWNPTAKGYKGLYALYNVNKYLHYEVLGYKNLFALRDTCEQGLITICKTIYSQCDMASQNENPWQFLLDEGSSNSLSAVYDNNISSTLNCGSQNSIDQYARYLYTQMVNNMAINTNFIYNGKQINGLLCNLFNYNLSNNNYIGINNGTISNPYNSSSVISDTQNNSDPCMVEQLIY